MVMDYLFICLCAPFPFSNIQGSPDLKAAREVADYLGTRHHEFHFTVQVITYGSPPPPPLFSHTGGKRLRYA